MKRKELDMDGQDRCAKRVRGMGDPGDYKSFSNSSQGSSSSSQEMNMQDAGLLWPVARVIEMQIDPGGPQESHVPNKLFVRNDRLDAGPRRRVSARLSFPATTALD